MKAIRILASVFLLMSIVAARGGTLTIFDTSVGPMFLELYEQLDPDRALKLARLAVSDKSRDYRDYLWLGQILSASGKAGAIGS